MKPRAETIAISALLLSATLGLCADARGRPHQASAMSPLWLDAAGRPNDSAREALALLAHAHEDGLDPDVYEAEGLHRVAASLDAASTSPEFVAGFERRLTAAVARYAHDVHVGRVDPRSLGYRLTGSEDRHDFPAMVAEAVAARRIAALPRDLAPPFVLYRNLRAALAHYRPLSTDGLPELPPGHRAVHPGEPYPHAPALAERLMLFGDLPAGSRSDGALTYSLATADGVRRFQRRHGLTADGLLGRETHAALSVTPAQRVRQLELALERLRWLPHLEDQRFVAVNIPMFRLWAWDARRAHGMASFQSGVIVGRALNTRTPVLTDEITEIVFRPYWNVPSSIVHNEIVPALRRDPDYLRRHDMEVVSAPDAPLRVRQRPGRGNALGLIKFVFPNDYDVYLHGTPAPALFAHARRDFSHGCVRVEDPVGFAEWLLSDRPGWDRQRIVAAMNGAATLRFALDAPVRVVLFYLTAVVAPEDGAVHFADDIYGHDARLDRSMRGGT